MIYLFDDVAYRVNNMVSLELKDNPIIQFSQFNCPDRTGVENYIDQTFVHPDAILLHNTYKVKEKGITPEQIKSLFIKRKIPFAFFSGGTEVGNYFKESNVDTANINASRMYDNLELFLEDFKKKNAISFPVLIFGSEYIKIESLELLKAVTIYLANRNENDRLEKRDREDIVEFLVGPIIKNELFNEDKKRLLDWLNNPKSYISVSMIIGQIKKFISLYR